MGKLIIDGNEVYEIDEECMKKKEAEKKKRTAPEKGGQRYDTRKNPACRILRLRRVAPCDIYPSAAVRSCPEGFLCHWNITE